MMEEFALPENGYPFEATVALRGVSQATTKTGNVYSMGIMTVGTVEVPFKAWGNGDIHDGVYEVVGKRSDYNGTTQVVITGATEKPEMSAFDLMSSKYDKAGIWAALREMVKTTVSDKGYQLFQTLLTGEVNGEQVGDLENLMPKFTSEVAAISHHDSVKTGLLAHSYKTGLYLKTMMECPLYDFCNLKQDYKDIIFVTAVLHDLGKTVEYREAAISEVGKLVSHRDLAEERVFALKKAIIDLYDEDCYYHILAMYSQHHGEYEEKPRTIFSLMVHYADSMEASVTNLSDSLEALRTGKAEQVYLDGHTINL